ncbi:TetR/AcrR family transcriptional regulator [Nonomuraea wenchangensis]
MSGRDPDRRRALLDAADRAIAAEGPDVSMAAIAAAAGVTKPILYRHFGDRSGLYEALADRHVRTVIAQLRPRFAEAGADLRARARATITAYLDLVSANLNLYRFLFQRAGAEDVRTRSRVTSLVRSLGEELGEVLAAEGVVPDPVRAQVLGHAFVGMVQTTGDWWLDQPGLDRDQVVESLVDVITAAVTEPALTPRSGTAFRAAGRT